VSVVVPARNERGNIEVLVQRLPLMGPHDELIFVEGHSDDGTWEEIQRVAAAYSARSIRCLRQSGHGKGDAVRLGFAHARREILMILDADLSVEPEMLPRFYRAIADGVGDFVNGSRLVYPMEQRAMRFANLLGNKFFAAAFSFLLGQPLKDTLCGTKVLRRESYEAIARNRTYFGEFDPFGDFDLLFGASRQALKIVELPVRYRERIYGSTNIRRWAHGWLLLRMTFFAARRLKFI
jgi:glycosyltransferase involved in cell wall biosynthesis